MQDLKTGHLLRASPRAQFVGQLVGSAVSVVFAVLAYALFTTAYAVPGPVLAAPMAMVCACTAYIPLASAHTTGGGQMWIDMAKVVNGESLMSHVIGFCVAGALLAIAAVLVRACVGGSSKVSSFIPNGIAFAVVRLHICCLGARLECLTGGGYCHQGAYVTPNWTIPRLVGSLAQWWWASRAPQSHDRLAAAVCTRLWGYRRSRVMVRCSAPMDYFRYMVLVASGFVLGEGIMAIVNALLKTAGVGALSCFGCVEGMCGGAGC